MNNRLEQPFYLQENVVDIAQKLLGKRLVTNFNGIISSGIITETEAYEGATDKASHAYNNRRTKRTETLFKKGGIAYVYLCYGIHHLFNVVTNIEDIPHAVLIRAIRFENNSGMMLKRRNLASYTPKFNEGPGKLSKSLGISTAHDGISLNSDKIWIEDTRIKKEEIVIEASPRIGIDYAEEDAHLPYRFVLKEFRNTGF